MGVCGALGRRASRPGCNYLSWRRDFACPLLAIVIVNVSFRTAAENESRVSAKDFSRTFLRRHYVTWRRDLAAPLLAMMFFRAMSYCANLRKWKLPILAYLRGHQLVLPGECVLREGDSGGLWCIGAPRFTARPGQFWGSCLCCCNYLSWRRDFACPLLASVIVYDENESGLSFARRRVRPVLCTCE